MLKPNPATYNPDPEYLRQLLERAGLTQAKAARALAVTPRSMRAWLADPETPTSRAAPYTAQFALEVLAAEYRRRKDALKA